MVTIRSATASDEVSLGRFGAALMRQHHESDPARFIQVERSEAGYGRFLVSRISEPDSRVFVADASGVVVGYVYADVEPTHWMELRGPCGVIQDVYVDESARGQGAGRLLMRAAIEWIRSRGLQQVVLMTKTRNQRAQDLFGHLGFRPTMLEMTLDMDPLGRSRDE
jgi:GNAT superfamily N-acetyltransferase